MNNEEKLEYRKSVDKILHDTLRLAREIESMRNYIWENLSCHANKLPNEYKILRRRYGVDSYSSGTGLVWYLLEKFRDGKLEIKE